MPDLSHEQAVLDAVREELRHTLSPGEVPINAEDELDLLPNADSVRLMRTVSQLERRFDVELDDDEIRKARTVADLVRLVDSGLAIAEGDR